MKHKWVIPLVILILLITANALRWEINAEKSTSKDFNTLIIKWKTDRWTGYQWAEIYEKNNTNISAFEIPTKPYLLGETQESIINKTEQYSITWLLFVAGCSIWLLLSVILSLKKQRKKRDE